MIEIAPGRHRLAERLGDALPPGHYYKIGSPTQWVVLEVEEKRALVESGIPFGQTWTAFELVDLLGERATLEDAVRAFSPAAGD